LTPNANIILSDVKGDYGTNFNILDLYSQCHIPFLKINWLFFATNEVFLKITKPKQLMLSPLIALIMSRQNNIGDKTING
jgi:hypothetical protein